MWTKDSVRTPWPGSAADRDGSGIQPPSPAGFGRRCEPSHSGSFALRPQPQSHSWPSSATRSSAGLQPG